MFYYVELQRAKNALRVVAIILAIFAVAALALRIWMGHLSTPDGWIHHLESSPSAHVTRQALPDGGVRIVVDDPLRHTHAVIDRHGSSVHMVVTEPSRNAKWHEDMTFGSMDVSSADSHGVSHVVADYHRSGFKIPIGDLFLATLPFGLLVASMLGGALAKENENHLELAWTKPLSRDRYAIGAIAVDLGAIVVTALFCAVVYLLLTMLFFIPPLSLGDHSGLDTAISLLAPAAWYALVTVLSASLKRGLGMVVGMSWLGAVLIPAIAGATAGYPYGLPGLIHSVALPLTYLDPLTFFTMTNHGGTTVNIGGYAATNISALLAMTVVYLALAVLQWRRVEA